MRSLALVVVVACSGGTATTTKTAPRATLTQLQWLVGDWHDTHWREAGGALYGVALSEDHFALSIIDDAAGPGPADGVLRLYTSHDGAAQVEWTGRITAASAVSFVQLAGSLPDELHIRRDDNTLHTRLQVQDAILDDVLIATGPDRAPELEAADRAFSDDTGKRGVVGWVAAFAPDGSMFRKGEPISGQAIHDMMKPVLDGGTLAWAPTASAMRGAIGFTVGTATYAAKDPKDNWRSSYVTIWAKQPDGSWKVRFDTGRPQNE